MKRPAPIAALVPVRGLAGGKSRLAPALGAKEREKLIRAMLEDVLDALQGSPAVGLLALVSADPRVAAIAKVHGLLLLPDPPAGGLSRSLQAAAAWLGTTRPADAVLMVAADLPTLTPALIAETVLASDRDVVIARSADGGTNLLLQQPPARLDLAFGPASCAAHRTAALERGLSVEVLDHPRLSRDLDRPEDMGALLALGCGPRSFALLRRLCGRNPEVRARNFSGVGELRCVSTGR